MYIKILSKITDLISWTCIIYSTFNKHSCNGEYRLLDVTLHHWVSYQLDTIILMHPVATSSQGLSDQDFNTLHTFDLTSYEVVHSIGISEIIWVVYHWGISFWGFLNSRWNQSKHTHDKKQLTVSIMYPQHLTLKSQRQTLPLAANQYYLLNDIYSCHLKCFTVKHTVLLFLVLSLKTVMW